MTYSRENPSESSSKPIEELANCLEDHLQHAFQEDVDPFEVYAHKLKVRLLTDMPSFKQNFIKGYHVLSEGLQTMRQKELEP